MSDQWSIVSGEYSDQHVSESGFVIIPTSTSLVTLKSRATQEEPVAIAIVSPASANPIKKVVEWLHNPSSVSKIPVVLTTITKPKILPVREVESLPSKPHVVTTTGSKSRVSPRKEAECFLSNPLGIATAGTKKVEIINALPQAYTLSVLGPQGLSGTKLCGYFSLGHHPETWPTSLRFGLHPGFRQIHESVESIYNVAGEEATLNVVMWSKVYDHRSGSWSFWDKTRDAAYEKLKGQSYIVKVVLDGNAKKIFNQLCAIPGLGRYRKPVLEGYETYFSMNEAPGFRWLSGEDGKKLYKQCRHSAN